MASMRLKWVRGVPVAHRVGASCVIQPGGSIRGSSMAEVNMRAAARSVIIVRSPRESTNTAMAAVAAGTLCR